MHRYGGPEVLELADVDLPPLRADEVRFAVFAAPVNRADVEIRAGNWTIQGSRPFPYTPGLEAVGEVIAVGDRAAGVQVGDRVITMMQKLGGIHGIRPGGYQEIVTVEANNVAVLPPELNPYELAALGLGAITAYNGLKRLRLGPGDRIVVHGASGGVGSTAVAMARAMKTRVIGTTLNRSKEEYLRRVGAETVVFLDEGALVEQLGPRTVDGVLETVGERTFRDSVAVLKHGGRLCLIGAVSGENICCVAWDLMQDLHLTGYSSENLTGDDLRTDMKQICQWLRNGKIRAPAYRLFPLAEAAQAHALMEKNALTGRALLVTAASPDTAPA